MFAAPVSRPSAPVHTVLTALLAGSLLFLGLALGLGPVGPRGADAVIVWLGIGGALGAPVLGALVSARLRGDAAPPGEGATVPGGLASQALVVEGALCEAGALLGGMAVLLHGPDARVLAALVVPLGRLFALRRHAAVRADPA